jgi:hypothetical protein
VTAEQGRWVPSTGSPEGMSPLRRFKGTLKEWRTEEKTPETGKPYRNVLFDFVDVEVLEATEPYPFPITQIRLRYADPQTSRGGTRWAVFSESARAVTKGVAEPSKTLEYLEGKSQEWFMGEGSVRVGPNDNNAEWHDELVLCWKVASVAGGVQPESGGQVMDHVVKLLDGKQEQEFYTVLFTDATVKANPKIIEQATKRELLPMLESSGLAYRTPDGTWHAGSNGTGSGAPVAETATS